MVINPIVVGMEIQVFTSGLYQPYGIYAGFVVLHYASHDIMKYVEFLLKEVLT